MQTDGLGLLDVMRKQMHLGLQVVMHRPIIMSYPGKFGNLLSQRALPSRIFGY